MKYFEKAKNYGDGSHLLIGSNLMYWAVSNAVSQFLRVANRNAGPANEASLESWNDLQAWEAQKEADAAFWKESGVETSEEHEPDPTPYMALVQYLRSTGVGVYPAYKVISNRIRRSSGDPSEDEIAEEMDAVTLISDGEFEVTRESVVEGLKKRKAGYVDYLSRNADASVNAFNSGLAVTVDAEFPADVEKADKDALERAKTFAKNGILAGSGQRRIKAMADWVLLKAL